MNSGRSPSSKAILLAVSKLESRWMDLLGEEGSAQVVRLLNSVDTDDDEALRRISNQLLMLFRQHNALDALREVMAEDLSKGVDLTSFSGGHTRGEQHFQPLSGMMTSVASLGPTYRCPIPGCNYTWRPQKAGQTVPFCPHHPGCRLEED
jgi:hypothetical protein